MKKLKSATTTKKVKSKKKGTLIMRTKYIVLAVIVVCAVILGTLMMMGPKLGLQTPPIEAKAMSYLEKHNLLNKDESIAGFKAINYYNYDKAAVVTSKRIFVYDNGKVFSIPLNKITAVFVKDSELGQREVLVSAQTDGVIGFDVYHTSVPKLLEILQVNNSIVKFSAKTEAQNTVTNSTNGGKI
jgi:hypothetical protein